MKRRTFLLGSLAFLNSKPVGAAPRMMGLYSGIASVIITDVTPDVSIEHLLAVFDAFSEKNLPFSCVVHGVSADGQTLQPGDRLSILLAGYAFSGGLIDLVAYVPDLAMLSSYFQGRRVREANAILRQALRFGHDLENPSLSIDAVACDDVENPKSPSGVRSTGVDTVIALPNADKPVSSEAWPNGVVRLFGGRKIELSTYKKSRVRFERDTKQDLLFLSALDFETGTIEEIKARAAALAEDLLLSERAGHISVEIASDLQYRDNYGFRRYCSVHLTQPAPEDLAAEAALKTFQEGLASLGILASVGPKAGAFGQDRQTDYWLPVPADNTKPIQDLRFSEVTQNCLGYPVNMSDPGKAVLPPGHNLAFGEAKRIVTGFDKCGVLWLRCVDIKDAQTAADLLSSVSQFKDVVISIRPEALATSFLRRLLLNQLHALLSDGVTKIVPVQRLGQILAPQGAELRHQRRMVASYSRTRPRLNAPSDTRRKALYKDAQIAWEYFEKYSNQDTGLCPATVNFGIGGARIHPTVTMWDVGSHIHALISARKLGLVDKKQYEKTIAQLLTQIRGRRSQGRLLPQGWLRVDRNKWGNKNFDGSDAGRLLSALENLRKFSGADDRLVELVDSWDLDDVVVDGRVHSVTDGQMHSVYRSHSAHYAAQAFRLWGVDAASPYEVILGQSDYDDQMTLLETVSWIGPLGAEPLLLEALELGMSKESAYLADVLFSAQLESYEENGRLVAVSEGPIDREPWFTYQGLQMDAHELTWALDTVGFQPKYANSEFWRNNLVVSSKAAFLWAAYRPHEYSDRLLEFVRQSARTSRGFASSIFSHSGRVTSKYTDINSNAVILQAIASILEEG